MGYALRQILVSTHFNYIKNIIGSLRVKFLGLVRRSCTLSLMVQFTFYTFGNIEKKTKMLSADVQKRFVAKLDALGFSLFLFFVLLVYCSLFDCIILVPGIARVMILPICMHM